MRCHSLLLFVLVPQRFAAPGRLFLEGEVERAREARVAWELALPDSLEARLNSNPEAAVDVGQFLHEKDASLPVSNARWDLLGPVGPKCLQLQSYGAGSLHLGQKSTIADDEGKKACGLQREPNCTVIAIGSNGQWGFEAALVSGTSCAVHTFDCTVDDTVRAPAAIRHRVTLHRYCIGSPPPKGRNLFLEVPRKPDGRPGRWSDRRWRRGAFTSESFRSYSGIVALAGLSAPPTLLKMDAEGYEWPMLADIISHPTLAPTQLALELHFQTQMPGLRWFGRYKSTAEILALGNALSRRGYLLVSRDDNSACRWCSEQLWVRAHARRARAAGRRLAASSARRTHWS